MKNTDIKLLIDCPTHIPQLAELWFQELGKPWIKNAKIENAVNTYTVHANRETMPMTWVAEDNGKPVGMVSLRSNDGIRDGVEPWLGSLIVDPKYRNKKIGQKLIDEVKRKAKEMGYKTLHLFALDPTLHQWYEKLGWRLIGEDVYDANPVRVMAIDLE